MAARRMTRADIVPSEVYAAERRARRQAMTEIKRDRRVHIGPFATFYFESFATMLHQVHEMLFIERGGEAQIDDELAAYNPLVPNGRELVATVMFEIDDPDRRARELGRLGGVEHAMLLEIDGVTVRGRSEDDVDRTNAAGKASSVQFVHFPLGAAEAAAFKRAGARVVLGIDHTHYAHMAILPEAVRAALATDLD
ncbi:MAG: DUF3501 family protein [Alphaproteobacteria bacterium]|nr:DUF3501 family protein [Alphaproteobacteria bacterium]